MTALDAFERGQLRELQAETIVRLADYLEGDVDELCVLAGRLPPCLGWVQADPGVAKLLGTLVALIDSRVTLPARPGGLSPRV